MELAIPTSLTGVAIAVPLQLDRKHDGNAIYFIELIRCNLLSFMGLSLTSFFVLAIWEVVTDEHLKESEGCPKGLLKVQFACVFTFTAAIFAQTLRSADLLRLLYHVREESGRFSMLKAEPKHGGVLHKENTGMIDYFLRKVRTPPPPGIPRWNFKRITFPYKLWCGLAIVLPKLIATMALGYFGSLYILRCDNIEDLVLNSLAAVFVLDIDTILYECFISSGTRAAVEHMAPIEVDLSNAQRTFQWAFSALMYPVLTVLISLYVMIVGAGCGSEHMPDGTRHFLEKFHFKLIHPIIE